MLSQICCSISLGTPSLTLKADLERTIIATTFSNLLLQNLFGEPVGCCEILRSAGGANPSGNDRIVVIKNAILLLSSDNCHRVSDFSDLLAFPHTPHANQDISCNSAQLQQWPTQHFDWSITIIVHLKGPNPREKISPMISCT